MVSAAEALPGRDETMPVPARHEVLDAPIAPPFPDGLEQAVVGMGCFWGAERIFWQAPGVYTTAVGYAGGFTKNPTYEEVCSGRTGHTEAVLVVFDPQRTSYEEILRLFWENHDPTQGMRQGNDQGTQYRSAIYTANDAQRAAAESSRDDVPGRARRAPATARSRPRSPRPGRSTTPRRTTSSTSRRTRWATAGSAARASPVPSVSSPRSRDREAPLHGRSFGRGEGRSGTARTAARSAAAAVVRTGESRARSRDRRALFRRRSLLRLPVLGAPALSGCRARRAVPAPLRCCALGVVERDARRVHDRGDASVDLGIALRRAAAPDRADRLLRRLGLSHHLVAVSPPSIEITAPVK